MNKTEFKQFIEEELKKVREKVLDDLIEFKHRNYPFQVEVCPGIESLNICLYSCYRDLLNYKFGQFGDYNYLELHIRQIPYEEEVNKIKKHFKLWHKLHKQWRAEQLDTKED